jgi:hypothetical protein
LVAMDMPAHLTAEPLRTGEALYGLGFAPCGNGSECGRADDEAIEHSILLRCMGLSWHIATFRGGATIPSAGRE